RKKAEEQERLAAEEAERKKAEEQERLAAEEAERKKAEEQERLAAEEAEDDDEWGDDDDSLGAATGKVTLQTYVPSTIAAKVKQMQQTGKSAETIVLTAVAECADRLPDLIAQARGPVREGGLFPGLKVIERGPGRPKKIEPANTRLQYSVSTKWIPTLKQTARQHRLKQSVLARLALGDYFNVPVRIERSS
ncbi:hypothetical protein, partial [Streptomyces griseoaurantiacus]|uniref:hypothetical protein n=1 Tax=Streptomyces griseoaurantiacus TaxID=68213 RepID=UPI003812EB35